MIYLITKNPKKQRCFLEEVKELIPIYYEIFAPMQEDEALANLNEWRVKFNDCNHKI